MDWSKAKTILIIAFLITNLLLVFFIIQKDMVKDPTLTKDFIDKVILRLSESNIEIDTEIPNKMQKLNTITVNYEKYNKDSVNKKFLESDLNQNDFKNGDSFEDDNVKISLTNNEIFFESKSEEQIFHQLNEDIAIKISRDFLLEKGYLIDDLKLNYIKKLKNGYEIEYSKIYNNIYIENTYTKFFIDETGVKKFNRLWLETKEEGDIEMQVGTAPKALLSLVGKDRYSGRKIVDISLCYYFNPNLDDIVDLEIDSREGRTIPAWRIKFDNGEIYIVDKI